MQVSGLSPVHEKQNELLFLCTCSRLMLLVSRPVLCFLTKRLWGKCLSAYCYIFSFYLIIYRDTVRVVKLSFFSCLKNKIKHQKMRTAKCALTSLFPVCFVSCGTLTSGTPLTSHPPISRACCAPLPDPQHLCVLTGNKFESCQILVDRFSNP